MVIPRILFYGPAKIGKTVAATAASWHGLVIAAPGALSPAETFLGIPREKMIIREAETLEEINKILASEAKRKYPTVYVDDLSLAIKREQGGKQMNWRKFDGELNDLSKYATDRMTAGTPFLITAHEQPDRISSGKFIRGGPQLPGQAPESFSGNMDVVLRGVNDETMQPWPFVMWSRSRGKWIAGDRLTIFPDMGPLNIGEGLRLRGFDIPYPDAWMKKASDQWAQGIAERGVMEWREVIRPAFERLKDKYHPRHMMWAATDALHRVVFQARRDDALSWLNDGAVQMDTSVIEPS